jgi:hypothetical protein
MAENLRNPLIPMKIKYNDGEWRLVLLTTQLPPDT